MPRESKKAAGTRFLQYFGPLLDALRGLGGSGTPSEVVERIALDLKVPETVQSETLPSGGSRLQTNVAWARFYLTREGLLDSSKRGVWSLTEKGRATRLSYDEARQIFQKWVKVFSEERRRGGDQEPKGDDQTPDQALLPAADYRLRLADLLHRISPGGFERLCQRLLREAGFIQVVVTGRTGDGGIDGYGTLQVNPLVSFKVLFQCKRYKDSVSAPQVRDFRGAMQGRADKAIIITTGSFTSEARKEASRDGVPPIELVDGQKVVEMFTELELGVRQVKAYDLDEAFFEEFR